MNDCPLSEVHWWTRRSTNWHRSPHSTVATHFRMLCCSQEYHLSWQHLSSALILICNWICMKHRDESVLFGVPGFHDNEWIKKLSEIASECQWNLYGGRPSHSCFTAEWINDDFVIGSVLLTIKVGDAIPGRMNHYSVMELYTYYTSPASGSRLALGPTLPPVQWVLRVFSPGRDADHSI
jgi:hypothetical protein